MSGTKQILINGSHFNLIKQWKHAEEAAVACYTLHTVRNQ